MPYTSRRVQQLAKRLASRERTTQEIQLEERYQRVMTQFRAMHVQCHAMQTQFRAVRKEYVWLQQVVRVKQQLIEQLLPYYPHPLAPEVVYAIELY